MKKMAWAILNTTFLGGLVQLRLKSALWEDGWFLSFKRQQSIDGKGNPIPWCTYSFIKFIEPRLKSNFRIFEYGCGNSTLYYSSKVKSIKAVEHDKKWADLIQGKLPSNAKVIYKELVYGGDYSKEVFAENIQYHIIIVDGRDRNNSLLHAIRNLTEDGIVVFDNGNLPQYQNSICQVMASGFHRLDFYGMVPIAAHTSCTTILYRAFNCLDI